MREKGGKRCELEKGREVVRPVPISHRSAGDDEDGVDFGGPLVACQTRGVIVTASAGWLDHHRLALIGGALGALIAGLMREPAPLAAVERHPSHLAIVVALVASMPLRWPSARGSRRSK